MLALPGLGYSATQVALYSAGVTRPPPSFAVTIVNKSTDQTAADYSTPAVIGWDSELVDLELLHDNSSNNSRLTIPSNMNGYYVVISAAVELASVSNNSGVSLQILKNGGRNYDGWGGDMCDSSTGASNTSGKVWIECFTQPILVSTGDYFEAELFCSDTSVDVNSANSSLALYTAPAATSVDGAHVARTSDSGISFFNFTTLAWDREVFDSAAYHDNVTNNSRITIPAGANGKVGVFRNNIDAASATGGSDTAILQRKNGATDIGLGTRKIQSGFSSGWMSAISKPITLATSDFLANLLYVTGDLKQVRSSFALQVYSSFSGSVVKKSADQTGADYSTPAVVTWNTEEIDTDAIHDTSSNTSRFTVPLALNGKYAVITASFQLAAFTGGSAVSAAILKNGSKSFIGFGGQSRHAGTTFSETWIQAYSQPVLLATGDYYEVELYSADTSITIAQTSSWFAITVLN